MRFSFISFAIGILIATGIAELTKPEYQPLRRAVKGFVAKPFQQDASIEGLSECDIPLSSEVPQDGVIIVGHAYGSPRNPYEFLGSDLVNLIKENRARIKHVIFTGDVFAVPSKTRWLKLKDFFEEYEIDFTVAPGNHDVDRGDNTRRDIFLDEMGDIHLSLIEFEQHIVIVEDSTRSDWIVTDNIVEIVQRMSNEFPSKKLVIVRHHIAIEELLPLANSSANKSDNLASAQELSKQFVGTNPIFISGDSGAFSRLPRSSCYNHQNITFYLNGLGGTDGDEVLVLKNGKITRLPIKS